MSYSSFSIQKLAQHPGFSQNFLHKFRISFWLKPQFPPSLAMWPCIGNWVNIPGIFLLVYKIKKLDQSSGSSSIYQHQYHLGTCWKWKFSSSTPDLLNQNLWEWGPETSVCSKPSCDTDVWPYLRTARLGVGNYDPGVISHLKPVLYRKVLTGSQINYRITMGLFSSKLNQQWVQCDIPDW